VSVSPRDRAAQPNKPHVPGEHKNPSLPATVSSWSAIVQEALSRSVQKYCMDESSVITVFSRSGHGRSPASSDGKGHASTWRFLARLLPLDASWIKLLLGLQSWHDGAAPRLLRVGFSALVLCDNFEHVMQVMYS
jgi:hypothetical protein